jgi:hypothetical protein
MGFLDWLFKRKSVQASKLSQPEQKFKKMDLSLEGTLFPLFTNEAVFIKECKKTGLAALVLPFAKFWDVFGRGLRAKAMTGSVRLLCNSCVVNMADSFKFNLPGGLGTMLAGTVAVGEKLPSNLPAAAKAAKCPYCGSSNGILVFDNPNYGEVTEQDIEALRELWRFRSQLWWNSNTLKEVRCGGWDCYFHIPRGEGYHSGSDMSCDECTKKSLGAKALPELKKNPDYFGISELRRARNFKFYGWRFEQNHVIESAG